MSYKFKDGDRVKVRATAHSKFSGMIGIITLRRVDRSYWVRFFDGDSVFWFGQGELEAAPAKTRKKRGK